MSAYPGMTVDPRAFRFMRANAGGIVGEAAIGAFALARAEAALRAAVDDGTARVRWIVDEDYDPYWMPRGVEMDEEQESICEELRRQAQQYGAYGCVVERLKPACDVCGRGPNWDHVASVWGVVGDGDYHRVVEAELALEAGFGEL